MGTFLANLRRLFQGAELHSTSEGPVSVTIDAEPAPVTIDISHAAIIIIDMQRDFLEPGGFGAALGNDVSRLQAAVGPCKDVLGKARELGMLVIHTREGHRPGLTDAPPHKAERAAPSKRI